MNNAKLMAGNDGENREGIGAMGQYQLITYALSKIMDCDFIFEGFKNLQHYQHYNVSKEKFSEDFNALFNLKIEPIKNRIIDVYTLADLLNLMKNNENTVYFIRNVAEIMRSPTLMQTIEENNFIKSLKSKLAFNDKCYFNKDKINVAVHIRTFTSTDCENNPMRELFNENRKDYYINAITNIKRALNREADFHIYSQGEEKNFIFLKNTANIFLHIEEYPVISLYHMINSSILLMANSSLSYIAHLLGDQITLIRDNFPQHIYQNKKILIDYNGNFNSERLAQLVTSI